MLHTIDAVGLSSVLLLLLLLALLSLLVLLGLLLQILRPLLPILLLFLDRGQNILQFYEFRVIWADPLIFQLFVLLSRY